MEKSFLDERFGLIVFSAASKWYDKEQKNLS